METVTVRASSAYDVLIGDGLLQSAASILSPIVKHGARHHRVRRYSLSPLRATY